MYPNPAPGPTYHWSGAFRIFSTAQPMGFYERTPILTTGKEWMSTQAVIETWAILLATFPDPFRAASGASEAHEPNGF